MIFISQILSVGFLATLAMTAFSYFFSYLLKGNFKEPQLLNYLIDKMPKSTINVCREHILGWFIHFSVGFLFVIAFKIVGYLYALELSFRTGIIFGTLAGLIGVGAWSSAFALHPNPPSINKTLFYIQLIFAHIMFAIVMVLLLKAF